jgi:hypothetical protein
MIIMFNKQLIVDEPNFIIYLKTYDIYSNYLQMN